MLEAYRTACFVSEKHQDSEERKRCTAAAYNRGRNDVLENYEARVEARATEKAQKLIAELKTIERNARRRKARKGGKHVR